jgi:hypothetical protein
MTRRVAALVLVLAGGLLFAAVAAPAPAAVPSRVQTGLKTPSGNVVCNAGPYRGRPLLACTVRSRFDRRGQTVWSMHATGFARTGFVRGNAATDVPRLGYGRTWRWQGMRCVSRMAGLTCVNGSGHGFFLSRQAQRIF